MKNFLMHPATIATLVTTAVVGPTAYFYGKSQGQKAANVNANAEEAPADKSSKKAS